MTSKYEIVIPTIGKVAPLKDLFIFELENLHFLVGKSDTIWRTGSYERALFLPSVVAIIILVIGILQSGVFLQALLIALCVFGLGIASCWVPYRNRLLSKEGKLIQGRIIETDEYKKEIGSTPIVPVGPIRVWRVHYGWEISALCAFRNPEDQSKVISTRRKAIRNDLVNKVIIDGTPIVVLYRNPHHFKVL